LDLKSVYDSRDMVVFAIDCSPKMMVTNEGEEESPFTVALKCVQSVLLTKVFSNTMDLVGVVFYGTVRKRTVSKQKRSCIH
jgi:hypothetical protein